MSNIHRIRWIDQQIRKKRYPGRQRIAEHFEISIRQVARDIEYLKDTLDAPIEYCQVRKGYYYREDAFVLEPTFITEDERIVLKQLFHQIHGHEGEQGTIIANMFKKIGLEQDESLLSKIPFPPNERKNQREPFIALIKVVNQSLDKKFIHPIDRLDYEHLRIYFYEADLLMNELLTNFDLFEVIEPSWFRKKISRRLMNLNKLNERR